MIAIALPDADAEIEPGPTGGGGRKPGAELDKLSNIMKQFNDQFDGLFLDSQSVEKRITEVIPPKVAADPAYQNAMKNTPSTARIEHDKALKRVITAMFKDDAQLFKQFQGQRFVQRLADGDGVWLDLPGVGWRTGARMGRGQNPGQNAQCSPQLAESRIRQVFGRLQFAGNLLEGTQIGDRFLRCSDLTANSAASSVVGQGRIFKSGTSR